MSDAQTTPHDDAHRPLGGAPGLPRLFYGVGLAVMIGVIAYIGRGVLVPLVISGFLAILITALKNALHETPVVGRLAPHWLAYLVAFAVIVAGFALFTMVIAENVDAVVAEWPRYLKRMEAVFADGVARYETITGTELAGLRTEAGDLVTLTEILNDFGTWLPSVSRPLFGLLEPLRQLASALPPIILYTAFILAEGGTTVNKLALAAADDDQRAVVRQIVTDIGAMVREYVSIKTLTSAITGLGGFVVLTVLGVDFAGFWALLLFALNFIPIIGSVIATAFPVILALIQPDGTLTKFILAAVFLTAVQQGVGSVIEPRLLGRSLNLSPLVILLSLSVWGSLWGVAGMLLCVPIMVALMITLSRFPSTRSVAILLSATGEIAGKRNAPAPLGA
ncbi:MAG: AI-2E family transporter [Pseudomonadota bacterium]